jgi:hypothetical protein
LPAHTEASPYGVLRTSVNSSIVLRLGRCRPVSTFRTVRESSPAPAASCSWVSTSRSRAARIRPGRPSRSGTSPRGPKTRPIVNQRAAKGSERSRSQRATLWYQHRGSGSDHCRAEYLPWMDDGSVEASDRNGLAAHDFVPGVQEQHEKVLAVLLAELRTHDCNDVDGLVCGPSSYVLSRSFLKVDLIGFMSSGIGVLTG